MLRLLFILFASIAALSTLHAATHTEFPFVICDGLLWVQVKSHQSPEPLNFLFDTGAGVSAINLPTAKRLGLKLGRQVSVQGVSCASKGYWNDRVSLTIGEVPLPSKCVVVDLGAFSGSFGRHVDGLIGADFLRNRIIQIDFAEQHIRLLDAADTNTFSLPLEFRPCGVRMPVSINGKRELLRLDTGCASTLQWVTKAVPDKCSEVTVIGLAKLSVPQTVTSVSLGDYTFKNVPTGLHKERIFAGEAGLLGCGLLSRFSSVTIDERSQKLWFGKLRQE